MKILIVEDEQRIAALLKEMVETFPNYTVVEICDSIETAVNYLQAHQDDLDFVFMDIQLSNGQCFEIFDKMTITLPIVFCTAYSDLAYKAFKNSGIDYILKPFNEQEIHKTIHKIETLKDSFIRHIFKSSNQKEMTANEKSYQSNFLIRLREKIYPVLIADIAVVILENEVVYLYTFKGEKHPVLKTLDEIENAVSPQQFYRINRQMIVNKQAIKEIESFQNQKMAVQLTIATTEQVLVPRLKVAPFLNWIES